MEGKYLYFADSLAADSLAMYPVSSLRGIEPDPSNATTKIFIFFLPLATTSDVEDDNDKVLLSISTGKHKEVMDAIVAEINSGSRDGGFITVADDVNSIYLHPDILGVDSITTV
tara:strand:+ start:161 stop:502 length:342 start_codon:yes stop_codon:yes gene_type:complete